MLFANTGQHVEALRWRHTRSKSTQICILNGRAIGQRIGERYTQFQCVGTGFDQRIDD